MEAPASAGYPQEATHEYGQQNDLQKVSVYIPKLISSEAQQKGIWVIYIHGGAWRDPTETLDSFGPARSLLLTSPGFASSTSHVLAFASINYRLSPHPDFPQDKATTLEYFLRNAEHPAHIQDVESAITYLQQKYGFGNRYLLVGHSCGATLAFQATMRQQDSSLESKIPKPIAVAGIAGIYDLRALRDYRNGDRTLLDIYQKIIEVPFGTNEALWDQVSPAEFCASGDATERNWKEGRLVVLAHSRNDQLVEVDQLQAMKSALASWEDDGDKDGSRKVVTLEDLEESHERMWSEGHELARVIAVAIDELQKLELSL
ncbi:hypothetical protein FQN54_005669 [Arachnomyces sp. PD_36]|nr:hypothetical protein FQN54_005669 [Arachnomyces sp. PD_36]